MDKQIEAYISEMLMAATGYPLLGEEGHSVSSFAGRVWVLDPIDGTMNYVTTHRDYAISLALCEDGRPVAGGSGRRRSLGSPIRLSLGRGLTVMGSHWRGSMRRVGGVRL